MSDASIPSPNPNLQALTDNGVAIWLDDLSRERLESGNLAELVRTKNVTGVTTNPSIFQAAMSKGERYDAQLRELAAGGSDVAATLFALTTDDVRTACDVLMPVYRESGGVDGRVSIEVEPALAHDTQGTVESAKKLFAAVDRENVLVKIPATPQGLSAISQALAEGISVNVTLIFSLDRYRAVMNAFLTGLEQARENGKDLSTIHSVASFFVSRVDAEIDKRLDAIGTDEAKALRGKAGLANARLAYQAWQETFSTPRWANLADDGAHVQRPLWASTGVKDPAYKDTLYVDELVAPQTVNTMPEKTLEAVADHGDIHGDAVTGTYEESAQVLDALERLGISYDEVTEKLEVEGVEKFVTAWTELTDTTQGQLDQAR